MPKKESRLTPCRTKSPLLPPPKEHWPCRNKLPNLLKDHLVEIYNKWTLLDDDIWCKLIIMEGNRRIGKAYARTPVISIDGSDELSFDGFRLGLNGFENPDRDLKTEECKKRLGKGIRIRMDESGNIIVMRFSKCNAYVKSWQHQLHHHHNNSITDNIITRQQQQQQSSSSSGSNSGSNKLNNAGGSKLNHNSKSANNDLLGTNNSQMPIGNPLSPSSAMMSYMNSNLDNNSNDNAIADDIIQLNGKIEYNKTYLLFDMKKFQANIAQELCRPYPDKKKLEQQCFSIIGLVSDANDILNLPCWVMVINIVAIEMLESRFNPSSNVNNMVSNGNHAALPNFISIFDHKQGPNHHKSTKNNNNNKEEDPYSIPANASTDSKSSTNNYGTTSTRNMSTMNSNQSNRGHHHSTQYNGKLSSSNHHHHYNNHHHHAVGNNQSSIMGKHGGSNNNIYGSASIASSMMQQHHQYQANGNDIGNILPPKLPPRAHAMKSHSKSSTNVSSSYTTDNNTGQRSSIVSPPSNVNNISKNYNNNETNNNKDDCDASQQQRSRKTKRNRFLDSLQLPLSDLTNSKSSPSLAATGPSADNNNIGNSKKNGKKSSKSKKISDGLKSLKSSSSKIKDINDYDEDSYANVEEDGDNLILRENDDGDDVDSVVDCLDDDEAAMVGNAANFNDLDIPTPDYETDENIYSVDSNFQMPKSCMQQIYNKQKLLAKEDLYYSGLQARVPQNISSRHYSRKSQQQSCSPDKMHPVGVKDRRSTMLCNNNGAARAAASTNNTNEKNTVTQNIGSAAGNNNNPPYARYRSASMQRYYSKPGNGQNGRSNGGYEFENPYSVDSYNNDTTSSRDYNRRSNYAINNMNGMNVKMTSTMSNVNYEIGRSSSGIYGNNSSSSSSDYADWHPQMRKHNSSGYLNSLFRNHVTSPIFYNTKPLPSHNNNNNNNNRNSRQQQQQQKQLSTLSKQQKQQLQYNNKQQVAMMHNSQKQQQQHQNQQQQQHQIITSNNMNKRTANNDGNYRTYDSSNDSDPSYTNSSDGLDIYDQIGGHAVRIDHQGSFMGPPISVVNHHRHHHHQRELYVGEWENL